MKRRRVLSILAWLLRDAAQATLIEAMVLFLLLLTAVASLQSTLPSNPSAPNEAAQRNVRTQLQDALHALSNLPTKDAYHDELNRVVARAFQGNTTELSSLLQRALPEGTGYRLVLDNGYAKRILSGPAEFLPIREQVSAEVLWHPDWDYTTLLPAYDVIPPSMALPVQGYNVAQGALVQEAGVPINVTLSTQDAAGNTATYHAGFTTSLREEPSAYLTLQGNDGTEGYNWSDPSVLPNITVPLYNDAQNGTPMPGGVSGSLCTPRDPTRVVTP